MNRDPIQPTAPTAPTETTPAPRAPVLSGAATEALWRVYDATSEWIRFADAKAGAILTADALLLATAVLELLKRNQEALPNHHLALGGVACAVLSSVALIASAIFCLVCIAPRMHSSDGAKSPLYFGHIAAHPDAAAYKTAAAVLDRPEESFDAISRQVWANARVAHTKYRLIAGAVWTLGLGLLFALIATVAALG